MHFVPLKSETLAATQRLAAELFPSEREHQLALAAALAPAEYGRFYGERGLASVRFWTAVHPHTGEVGGLAGVYGYEAEPAELWLAWFGLRAEARGHGRGAALLDGIIGLARAENRRVLRLWTTDESEYARALQLYAARGFTAEPWPALPGETWGTLVLSLGLDGRPAPAWAMRAGKRELCGRELPQLVAA
ncbi:MAG TPA: GNAT family N-acetyltransferase [Opitutaceae bacterium]